MNNKKKGTEFEVRMCRFLKHHGWWVHFIEPKRNGAQPFDIIAVKDGRAMAIDCKTCKKNTFSIRRLEDNQKMAFDRWIACGNSMPIVAVEHDDEIYMIPYETLVTEEAVSFDRIDELRV